MEAGTLPKNHVTAMQPRLLTENAANIKMSVVSTVFGCQKASYQRSVQNSETLTFKHGIVCLLEN